MNHTSSVVDCPIENHYINHNDCTKHNQNHYISKDDLGKQLNTLMQNWFAFKRFAEAVFEKDFTTQELIELITNLDEKQIIKDKGFPLRDLRRWILSRKIISGLRSTIEDHGPIEAHKLNSAAKRIVGKLLE
jgi:hypothetical protein